MLNVQVSLLMFHEMRAVMKCIVHSGGNLKTVDYTIQQSWQHCVASSARYICAVILTALHHYYIIIYWQESVRYQSAVNMLKVNKVEHTTSRQQLLLFNTVSLVEQVKYYHSSCICYHLRSQPQILQWLKPFLPCWLQVLLKLEYLWI